MFDEAKRVPEQEPSLRKLFGKAGLTVLMLLLGQSALRLPLMLLQQMSYHWTGHGMGELLAQLGVTVIYALSMLLAMLVGLQMFGCRPDFAFPMARVRADYLRPAVWVGLGVAMGSSLLASLVTGILQLGGVYSQPNIPSFHGGLAAGLVTLLATTLLPAVLEELLFRGVLLQPLRRYGDKLAVVVSALLFAFCHPTLPQFLNAFIVGLCLGVLAVRTGSLVVGMTVHLVYNSIACMITILSQFGLTPLAVVLSWGTTAVFLVSGCAAMFTLRRRFGIVWRLPRDPARDSDTVSAVGSACTSVPLLAALLVGVVGIVRNIQLL